MSNGENMNRLSDSVCHGKLEIVEANSLIGKTIVEVDQVFNCIDIRCDDGTVFCIEAWSVCHVVCQKLVNDENPNT